MSFGIPVRNGLGLGLLASTSLATGNVGATAFSPLVLFQNGEQGVWYDPSDISTLFQDAAGTTPVTAVEQPVGLMLDKSRGLTLGSELVTNGTFDSGTTGWSFFDAGTGASISVSSGRLSLTGGTSFARLLQTITTVTGQWYKFTADIVSTTGVSSASRAPADANGAATTGSVTVSVTTPPQSVVFYFQATGTSTVISPASVSGSGLVTVVDNISVKSLAGNHATQATSAARPVLSARVNLLTKTEQFDDAVWTKGGVTISADAIAAPNGTTTADKWQETAGGSAHNVRSASIAVVAGTSYRLSIYAKAAENSYVGLFGLKGTVGKFFNLSNGTVGNNIGSAPASSGIQSVGNGWYYCWIEDTEPSNAGRVFDIYSSKNGTAWDYSGTLNDGLYIWGADLRVANDTALPVYQRVNVGTPGSSTTPGTADYDTVGFPYYLRFDGVDDSMATASINFTSTDKMTLVAGIRKLSEAAFASIVEFSSTVDTNNGAFVFGANAAQSPDSSRRTLAAGTRGTNNTSTTWAYYYGAPITNVFAASYDNAGIDRPAQAIVKINATTPNTQYSGVATTAANYGNYPLYIGSRNNASARFDGRLYSLVVLGRAASATEITNTETWVNGKTKAYTP